MGAGATGFVSSGAGLGFVLGLGLGFDLGFGFGGDFLGASNDTSDALTTCAFATTVA